MAECFSQVESNKSWSICSLFNFHIIICLFLSNKTRGGLPDPYSNMRLRTSRVIIWVEGRDPDRQLTTYDSVDGIRDIPLSFGFPPRHRRHFDEESMEIFDSEVTGQRTLVRRITLRHPWHDVYLSWDQHLNIKGCSGSAGGRNDVCSAPPYWFLEKRFTNTTRDSITCFKLRIMTSTNTGQQVAYAHVKHRTWELRLQTQRALLTRALSSVARRMWLDSINSVFSTKRGRAKRNRGRHRRCSIDLASLRQRLMQRFQLNTIQRRINRSMKDNNTCFVRYYGNNTIDLITTQPWINMTSAMKSSLTCHVDLVVRDRLKAALLGSTHSRCVGGKKWSRKKEQKKRRFIDMYLAATWRRKKINTNNRLIEFVSNWLDTKITSFCADGLT